MDPLVNACEVDGYRPPREKLFKMWVGASYEAYVWTDSFDAAFELFVEHLDTLNLCDAFSILDTADLVDAASDLNIPWQAWWPDYSDEDFQKVLELAERGLTSIGHTTLKNCEKKLGGGPLYLDGNGWGGDEITDAAEIELVQRASLHACWGHSFLEGDLVWLSARSAMGNDGEEGDAGVYTVEDVNGEDLDIRQSERFPTDNEVREFVNISSGAVEMFDPNTHKMQPSAPQPKPKPQPAHTDLQHESDFFFGKGRLKMPPSAHDPAEHKRMSDFFFGKKPPPPRKGGGGFLGLGSFDARRRRR